MDAILRYLSAGCMPDQFDGMGINTLLKNIGIAHQAHEGRPDPDWYDWTANYLTNMILGVEYHDALADETT